MEVKQHIVKNKRNNGFHQSLVEIFTFAAILDSLVSVYIYAIPSLIRYFLLGIWAIIACSYIFTFKRATHRFLCGAIPLSLFVLLYYIKLFLSGNYDDDYFSPLHMNTMIISIVFVYIMVNTISCLSANRKRRLIKLYLILGTLTIIPSILYLGHDSSAVRLSKPLFGIASFQYIYASIALVVVALFLIVKVKTHYKLVITAFFIINLILLLLSSLATAFIFVIIGMFIILMCSKKMTLIKLLIMIGILTLLVFVMRPIIAELVYKLAESNNLSEIMRYRFNNIGDMILGIGKDSSWATREVLMGYSWESFKKFPIFGIPFSQYRYGTIGMHETWISLLGTTGIFGTFCYIMTIISMAKIGLRSITHKRFKLAFQVILLLYLALSFFNPLEDRDTLVALFVIIPLFDTIIFSVKNKSKQFLKSAVIKSNIKSTLYNN